MEAPPQVLNLSDVLATDLVRAVDLYERFSTVDPNRVSS
jgi:hypothetical protein